MKDLKQTLDEYVKQTKFNGAVLVSVDGEIVLEQGYGYANIEHGIKNTPDTVFRIASITKQFTAASVMKLVEEGKVDLSWTIDRYFPEYRHGKKITVHHLMSNSAGIPNFNLYMDFYEILKSEQILMELINLVKDEDLLFKPGTEFYYSISGYLMLQHIIEKESGISFEAFLKKNFFDVLGMNSTGLEEPKRVIMNKAYGYKPVSNGFEVSDYVDMRIAGGGGGIYSTIKDLHLWNMSLLRSKILKSKSTDLIFTGHVKADQVNSYGYGMIIAKGDFYGSNRIRFYHTGGGSGVRSLNTYYPEEGVEMIFISNIEDRDTFNAVTDKVQEMTLKNI
mgnify:CR=1 FL=1